MSIIQGNAKSSGVTAFYPKTIEQSLRFNDNDSAYLSKSFTTATDAKKFTWSGWVKRSNFTAVTQYLFSGYSGNSNSGYGVLYFQANTNKLVLTGYTIAWKVTTQVFRDPSAWYHIVLAVDTTQATAADRISLYVNGVEVTDFSTNNNPGLNSTVGINTTATHYIGADVLGGPVGFYDGYMAEVHFVDGTAHDASTFGELKSGVWVAKDPGIATADYGTNGFYLAFADNVNDSSGKGNNWTANNITSDDYVLDSPTDNFCTWNPLARQTGTVGTSNLPTFSDGNLTAASSANNSGAHGTFLLSSGQWYWEVTLNTNNVVEIGIAYDGSKSARDAGVLYHYGGGKRIDGTLTTYGSSYTTGDVIGIALDADANTVTFYKNNVSQGAISYTPLSTNPTPAIWMAGGTSTKVSANFGQQDFTYTPPTGYLALSTANLPNPTIDPAQDIEPRDYFETFLYTGNGTGLQVGDVIKKPADTTTISNSLVFDRPSDAYLSKSSVEGDDRTKITISLWVKRSSYISSAQSLISAGWSGSGWLSALTFSATGNILWFMSNSGGSGAQGYITSDLTLKDTSSWHHIVAIWDTTQATSTDRMRLYLDGVRLTVTNNATPSQNALSYYLSQSGNSGYYIGQQAYTGGADNFDGYMAEIHYIDGYVYEPTTFGSFDANGIWIPKAVTGVTYGTAGWHLDFSDGTSTTTLGEDSSGNNADWTLNNFATTNQVADSPTNNHFTMSYTTEGDAPLSEGNLQVGPTTDNYSLGGVPIPSTGKWWFEGTVEQINWLGIGIQKYNSLVADGALQDVDNLVFTQNQRLYGAASGTYISYGATFGLNDIIALAVNMDDGELTFYINGSSQGTKTVSDLSIDIRDYQWVPKFGAYNGNGTWLTNFGQRDFYGTDGAGTLPAGYKSLCENNITVDETNIQSPDLVWIKNRSAADSHQVYDSVRGVQKVLLTDPDTNPVEADAPNGLLSFNANGFTIGSQNEVNTYGEDYVAWNWKLGGAPSATNSGGATPTSGSIMVDGTASTTTLATATMYPDKASVNSVSKCGVMTYTSPSTLTTGDTIANPFGFAPDVMFIKKLTGSAQDWGVYHKSLGNTHGILLNETGGSIGPTVEWWNNTTPTSSLITLGRYGYVNNADTQHVCYAFAEVENFSKFGSYTGNGSADGPFVYTGFRPAFVMIKAASSTGSWLMLDTTRSTYNIVSTYLTADNSGAEAWASAFDWLDITANGFKNRNTGSWHNTSGVTYIYACFAENPFKYSNAR